MKRLITRFSSVIVALALHSTVNAQCSPDLTKPTFSSCPSNMTVSASSLTGTCYYTIANQTPFYPTGSDVCTPPPLLTYQLTYFPNGQPVVGPLTNPTLTGIQLPTGTNIFVWRVIDQAGNISNPCTYNVVVNDNTAPVITCGTSGAQNVTANASCKYVVSGTSWDATATDNCTVDSVKYVLTGATTGSGLTSLNGLQFNLGTTTVTWTAYDNWTTPNTSTCSFTVNVSDVTPPVLTCNNTSNQSLNTDAGVCTFTRTGAVWNASATDNCSVTSVFATLTGATTGAALTTLTNQAFNVGTTVVTWTATDGSGNTTTCSFDVTITDNVAPVVTVCPIDQTVNMAAGVCTYTHSGILWNPTATDNCAITYAYALTGATILPTGGSTMAGQVFNSGVTNVLWTITDISGNTATCAYTVTVVDNQDPVITCGVTATQNITLGAGLCTYTHSGITWNATATDNCSVAAPTYLLSGVSTGSGTTLNGQVFALGTTTVTWTATDNSGRTSTCSYDVIVTDTEEPTLVSCGPSGDQTVNMDAGACTYTQPDASWNASFTDNCTVASTNYALTGATTGSGTSLSGIAFNYGVTTVTWTATDNSALTTTCSFTVTVNDNQVPIITCASDQPVNTDLGSCDYTKSGTDWDAVVSDNCPTIVTYALTGTTSGTGGASVDGVVFQPGATTITWSVTDSHGNTSTCSHIVTVTDVELPVVTTCGPGTNTTVAADADVCTYTNDGTSWDAIATDNCTVSTIVYSLGGATTGTGATTLDNVIFNLGTTTVLWTITDNSGNTATCTYDITVDDTQNPIITCNQTTDLNLPADGGGCTLLHTGTSWDATATDNCSIATVLCDLTGATTATGLTTLDGVVFTGTTTVTWTATDVNGLTSTCGFDITVIDSEFPVISVCGPGVNTSVTADAGVCTHTNNSTSWDIVASDNCAFTVDYALSGVTSGTGTSLNGVPFNLGTTTVLWTATDGAGNATTCTFDITVTDDEDPTITCVADQALNTDAGVCTYTIAGTALDATGSDNCSITIDYVLSGDNTGTGSSLDGVVLNPGVTNVLWTATDGSGNAVTCSYTITVTDVELPVITLCGAVIDTTVVADAGVCTYTNTGLGWDATATDNCTVSSIIYQLSGVTSGTASSLDGVIFNLGVTNVLWTVTDNSGNTTTCTYNVTVLDDQLPIISTCGGSGTVIAAADAGVCTHLNTGTGLDALATDNCSITSIIYNVSGSTSGTGTTLDGFVFNPGISTVLWTVTDNSGNISTCTFDVNVPDTENPVITSCGGTGDVIVTTDPSVCTYTQTSTVWDVIATDNCVIGSYQYDLTGATTATGITTLNGVAFNQDTTAVLWTVTDLAGNTATCTFNVIVQDNELPAITCIADQFVNTDAGVCDYTVVGTSWDPTGSDNCSTVYSYTLTGATSGTGASLDGIVLNPGITAVNWTVSDAAGNTATCSYSVTVSDAELPVITLCGAVIDTTVIADAGVCTYTNIGTGWDATATDNCTVSSIIATLSGATSGTSNTLENVLFNLGTTNVLWTVTDNSGNTTTCTFNVNVLDDQLPTVTVCGPGADVNVPTDLSVCTYTHAGIAWDATAADNCSVASIDYSLSGVTSGTGISLDGVTFNSGITSVLWTITDGSGNTTTCSYNVTVEDEEAPIIASCGGAGDTIVSADAGVCNFTHVGLGFDPTATDNCTIATVLCDLSGATSATGLTTLDAVTFNNDTTTVLWTVTDLAGNTATCTFNVIVQDNELPLITCAADQTVIADAGVCTYTNIGTGWDALATDNCSIDSISYTLTGATVASGLTTLDGFEFELDTTLVTWTATDGAGNTTSCSFNVIVEDTELPIITCIADSTVST
ncbi:MAG: beta strand repeat-containing protein, partial [Flavobacteriia bacterium]